MSMTNHKGPPESPDPMDDELPDPELRELGDELGRMYHHETLAYGHSLDRVYARLQELERSQPSLFPADHQVLSVPAPTSPSKGIDSMQNLKTPAQISTRAQQPPRRPVTSLRAAWRTVAAVLVVALLGTGFFALLHGIPRPGGHPNATATRIATATTATTALNCTGSSAPGATLTTMPQPIPSL